MKISVFLHQPNSSSFRALLCTLHPHIGKDEIFRDIYPYLKNFLTPYRKINSKWVKDLSIRPETITFLKENIGRTVFDINCSNIFLDWSPKAKEIKEKINKLDSVKLKRFGTAKETINKTNRQPAEWEKIFVMMQLTRVNIQNI